MEVLYLQSAMLFVSVITTAYIAYHIHNNRHRIFRNKKRKTHSASKLMLVYGTINVIFYTILYLIVNIESIEAGGLVLIISNIGVLIGINRRFLSGKRPPSHPIRRRLNPDKIRNIGR